MHVRTIYTTHTCMHAHTYTTHTHVHTTHMHTHTLTHTPYTQEEQHPKGCMLT